MITNTSLLFEFPEEALIAECSSLAQQVVREEVGTAHQQSQDIKMRSSSELLHQLSYIYIFTEAEEKAKLQVISFHA